MVKTKKGWNRKCLILAVIFICGCSSLNSYQKQGDLRLVGLAEPVTVMRDEKGMAYIYAGSLEDATDGPGVCRRPGQAVQYGADPHVCGRKDLRACRGESRGP